MSSPEPPADLDFEVGRILAWMHSQAKAVRGRQEAAAHGSEARVAPAAETTPGEVERNRSIANDE